MFAGTKKPSTRRNRKRYLRNAAPLDDEQRHDTAAALDEWMRAAARGYNDVLRRLAKEGVPPGATDRFKKTALMHAAENGHTATVKTLLSLGGEGPINAQDRAGATALMLAAKGGHVGAAQLLLESGADRALKDEDGYTALMYAAEKGSRALARILTEGAEEAGRASAVAAEHGHAAVARDLRRVTHSVDPVAPSIAHGAPSVAHGAPSVTQVVQFPVANSQEVAEPVTETVTVADSKETAAHDVPNTNYEHTPVSDFADIAAKFPAEPAEPTSNPTPVAAEPTSNPTPVTEKPVEKSPTVGVAANSANSANSVTTVKMQRRWDPPMTQMFTWTQDMQDKASNTARIAVPANVTHISVSGVRGFAALGPLPPDLDILSVTDCPDLEALPPDLPDSLRVLDCSRCPKIRALPRLPPRLRALVCGGCPLEHMPALPLSISELECPFPDVARLLQERNKAVKSLQEACAAPLKKA